MQYWLMKSEPSAFSIDDLYACPNRCEHWDGVRNYQARNMMRDEMAEGDRIFFYHSACAIPGIVGIARVVKSGYPDFTAWDPKSKHFDSKSTPKSPRWFMVDIEFEKKFDAIIPLSALKAESALAGMSVLEKGSRLSIMPVAAAHWQHILSMG